MSISLDGQWWSELEKQHKERTFEDTLTDLTKKKLTSQQMYLLLLRQILLNQCYLLREANGFQLHNDSVHLVKRLEEFFNNQE